MARDKKAKSGKEIAKELEKQGFKKSRQSGSHATYTGPNGQGRVTVPIHGSGSLPAGTQRSIERSIEEARKKQTQQNDTPTNLGNAVKKAASGKQAKSSESTNQSRGLFGRKKGRGR